VDGDRVKRKKTSVSKDKKRKSKDDDFTGKSYPDWLDEQVTKKAVGRTRSTRSTRKSGV
jgi:hypothetical protein